MRDSNLELLRIVSMFMILIVHADGASLGLPEMNGNFFAMSAFDAWRLIVESIVVIGVNCFTLISGYFGIRIQWKGIGIYLFQCLFYSVGIYVLVSMARPQIFSFEDFVESFLVLSRTDLWYVPAYFGLMILSPFLNAGIRSLSKRSYEIILGIFILFNLWCGWYWEGKFNPTGYTVIQLIMVYLIGRYLGIYIGGNRLRRSRLILMMIYLVSTALIFISSIYLPSVKAFAYNSPFVLISSVCMFGIFAGLQFKSRTVNYLAKSSFAVYLIHKAPLIWGNVMRPLIVTLWNSLSLTVFTFEMLGICVLFYLVALAVDPIRRYFSRLIFKRI